MLFIEYPKCSTCKKAKKHLEELGVSFEDRNIVEDNPTKEELTEWIAASGYPVRKFFNTSGMKYRELGLKDRLPQMTDEEKAECRRQVQQHFRDTVAAVEKYHARLLVMDEVLDAVSLGMLDDEELADFLKNRPEDLEVVMTGRAPTPCTDPLADYITRMQKVRHPFDKGLNARRGVEF